MASEFADKAYHIRQGEEPDIASLETYLRHHLPGLVRIAGNSAIPPRIFQLTYL